MLAVELHQGAAANDNDLVFGLQVDAISLDSCSLPTPPRPRLSITRMPTAINIRWTNGPLNSVTNNGFALEGADRVTGPWIEVQPMSTNMVISTPRAAQFYRLRLVRDQ